MKTATLLKNLRDGSDYMNHTFATHLLMDVDKLEDAAWADAPEKCSDIRAAMDMDFGDNTSGYDSDTKSLWYDLDPTGYLMSAVGREYEVHGFLTYIIEGDYDRVEVDENVTYYLFDGKIYEVKVEWNECWCQFGHPFEVENAENLVVKSCKLLVAPTED